MTIGSRLRKWREAEGLNQRGAAERAELSQTQWCKYENDETTPRAGAMKKLIAVTAGSRWALSFDMFVQAEARRAAAREERAAARTGTEG